MQQRDLLLEGRAVGMVVIDGLPEMKHVVGVPLGVRGLLARGHAR
jgi:hypothetical protein